MLYFSFFMTNWKDMLGYLQEYVESLTEPSRGRNRYVCPLCGRGHKSGAFALYEDATGTPTSWYCFGCGQGGDIYDLVGEVEGITEFSDKFKRVQELYGADWKTDKKIYRKRRRFKHKTLPIADIETRNETYRALINVLTLTQQHKKLLHARGLSDKDIEAGEYRTYPIVDRAGVADTLLRTGFVLEGVPGFYQEEGKWTMIRMPSGILIPNKNGLNQVQGFQVRKDDDNDADIPRYLTLSSRNRENGSPAKASIHMNRGNKKSFKEVLLTEGPLKANVIAAITGKPVIAIQGVNSTEYLHDVLVQLIQNVGTKKVCICLDMDMCTNNNVKNALKNIKGIIKEVGLYYSQLVWDHEEKGLDDWLYKKIETTP